MRQFIYPAYWSILVIISLLTVSGCKKNSEAPDPDMANKVSGTYSFSTISISGTSQPTTVARGSVMLIRNGTTLDKVDLTLSYTTASSSGSITYTESKTISLQQSGNSIDLYNGTTKIGSWVTGTVTLTSYPFNTSIVSVTAIKQ